MVKPLILLGDEGSVVEGERIILTRNKKGQVRMTKMMGRHRIDYSVFSPSEAKQIADFLVQAHGRA